uniref:Putative neurobeachin homolog n=1 Tax=Angiostrongylus cantonensis TaxID=6313 RepID=A0A158P712_ANGCA
LPRISSKTTVIHSCDESPQETFERMILGIKDGSVEKSEIVDQLFNTLVGGQFDLETRYVIEDSSNIERMLTLLTHSDETLQAEIWSIFLAVVRKSRRNLEACSRVSMISKILEMLPETNDMLSDLLVQLLGVLMNYSITVKETKQFLRALQAVNDSWPRNALKLLQVMKQMPMRDDANVIFSFPGKSQAGIIVPPFARFPCQSGWTFTTWLRMDPISGVLFEKEKPYLYCFRSSKSIGYSCHFMGNALVLTMEKSKSKIVTICTKKELIPRKWHHIAIAHSYSRWGRSEIKFYFDGELSETTEANWPVSTTEQFDRCSIGVSPEGDPDTAFAGQMGAVYLFADCLSLEQANSLFCLGPGYQSYFVHDSGCNLPEGYRKHLFDGHLSSVLVMAYCPKNCHGQLCLNSPLKVPSTFFVQVPHAVMKEVVKTCNSNHKSFFRVSNLTFLVKMAISTLLSVISLLLASSQTIQQQLYQSKGFLIIGHTLQKASSKHITMKVAEQLIDMAKFLLKCPAGGPLLKQLFEHILFNPKLWITSAPTVQAHLYNYLATDFLSNTNFHHIIRQLATFGEMCNALKFYYWVTMPKPPSTYQVEERPETFSTEHIIAIRSSIIVFLNRLILLNSTVSSSQDAIREQEIHQLMNFVATVHEDDNLYDVLSLLNRLLGFYPHIMVPIFDKDKAIGLVFKLLSSPNQLIRIPALKMFGFYLQRSTLKRKTESVAARHLYTLITERLLIHTEYLTLPTYIVLFEILTEQMTPDFVYTKKEAASSEWRFENPMMLKVIANLITQSMESNELMRVKKLFLLDIINMCRDGNDNRRTILQMSVWQEWLISISYVFPRSEAELEITELVYEVFSILLQHAIRYEYGGWRVWVDTLAIAHSKVSFERLRGQQKKDLPKSMSTTDEMPTPIYRTPEFCWSSMHLRLLGDLLTGIESVVGEWNTYVLADKCNLSENQIFVGNTVHVISQLADSLIMACGGLLPLLASATSPNSELEIADSCQQELSIECAAELLSRFVHLADIFIFASGISFAELEQEKNMPSGGVLRQALRLIATSSVRHILTARVLRPDSNGQVFDVHANSKNEAIYDFVKGAIESVSIMDLDRLLQDVDLQRIRGAVYRDMVEENRQAQFLALAVVYLLSVLMVSRYRDILEPPWLLNPWKMMERNTRYLFHTSKCQCESLKISFQTEELSKLNASKITGNLLQPADRRQYLTNKLQTALETTAPLFREIMTDFRAFFQKTLLGTHGQEIMNDNKVLETLKNRQGSVIELVMLLCSQEWQTSLQKHAGLAFIELVNEGRLMAHATRDHVLRVSNEADFILNRLRAEDVSKHAHFESETATNLEQRCVEETRWTQTIQNGRRRDSRLAAKLLGSAYSQMFWRLDVWEDDSRRRRRFVPNVYGSKHEEARVVTISTEDSELNEEEKLRVKCFSIAPGRGQYFELVDESDIDKWAAEIDPPPSSEVTNYTTTAKLIAPGVVVPGTLSITATDLFFDADEEHPLYKKQDPKVLRYCESLHGRWNLQEIRAVFLRRHLLQNVALELFLATRTAVMFAFPDQETVRDVVYQLPRVGVGVKYGLPQSRKTSLMTPRQLFKHSDMCLKWQKREISNFDYLMFLNTVAGRTFNDLNQYPVFPWILTNYTSDHLDLNIAANFRDLSKPVGALSESRRKFFQERYTSWDNETIPAFHYGTHYSTQAFTLNWLIRVEPFTTMFLDMQGGRFDHPDRVFHSIAETWERSQKDSHDVKELIPELFYLPEMMRNNNGFELGTRSDGAKISDVLLPKWASSPEQFVLLHRQALESDLVSCQLNQWIDLIFGYKQKGPEAVRATNVFYYLTYEGAVSLKSIESATHLEAIQQQIASFGQTPAQLLAEAHPPRHSVMTMTPLMFRRCEDDLCMLMKFISNSPVVYLAANTFQQLSQPTVVSVAQNLVFTELPLTVDPLLASGNPSIPVARRHLGDSLDHRLTVSWNNFVSTTDSKCLITCGYPDYSFRVIDTDSARVRQVIYGHGDVVTCIARSETSLFADCYVVTGSSDCTVALWHWNGMQGFIVGEYNTFGETASPRAILTGHEATISALTVSAEHGIVLSGSEGECSKK